MAQIFVSHSSQDRELVDLLARAFAATKVRAINEEFEAITQGPATAQRITQHIAQANAVFVVLGRSVEAHVVSPRARHCRPTRMFGCSN